MRTGAAPGRPRAVNRPAEAMRRRNPGGQPGSTRAEGPARRRQSQDRSARAAGAAAPARQRERAGGAGKGAAGARGLEWIERRRIRCRHAPQRTGPAAPPRRQARRTSRKRVRHRAGRRDSRAAHGRGPGTGQEEDGGGRWPGVANRSPPRAVDRGREARPPRTTEVQTKVRTISTKKESAVRAAAMPQGEQSAGGTKPASWGEPATRGQPG